MKRPDESRIIKIFHYCDLDHDGRLAKEEFVKCLGELYRQIPESEIANIYYRLDADNNGYIEYTEFMKASMDRDILTEDQNLRAAFNFFDKDRGGTISLSELRMVFADVPKAELNKMIEMVDTNKDGQISFDEFKKLMNSKVASTVTGIEEIN